MNSNIQQHTQTSSIERHIHWSRIIALLVVAVLSGAIFGCIGYLWGFSSGVLKTHTSQNKLLTSYTITPTPTPIGITVPIITLPPTDTIAGWKVYTSSTEKASFRYPDNWSLIKSPIGSVDPKADSISVQSPDGQVTVNWVSLVSGLGGGCNTERPPHQGGCPLLTFISKTPINGARGLYVVSGTITSDETNYRPFFAVQDNDEMLMNSRLGYDEYQGRNNGGSDVIFSTGGIYADGPQLSQADANAWFNKPSVQQAKQILESLTY